MVSRCARRAATAGSEEWVTLRVQFESEADACFVVLGLGRLVDVLEPASYALASLPRPPRRSHA
jgi:hypothetical protein